MPLSISHHLILLHVLVLDFGIRRNDVSNGNYVPQYGLHTHRKKNGADRNPRRIWHYFIGLFLSASFFIVILVNRAAHATGMNGNFCRTNFT
jgi:hypothetical protein